MPEETREEQITIRITKRMRQLLDKESDRERRTISDLVNFALEARYPAMRPEPPVAKEIPNPMKQMKVDQSGTRVLTPGAPRKKPSK